MHLFCGSLALALLLDPALPHLVAAFRQDSGLAYSEYGAALALFVETQHSRLCTGHRGGGAQLAAVTIHTANVT